MRLKTPPVWRTIQRPVTQNVRREKPNLGAPNERCRNYSRRENPSVLFSCVYFGPTQCGVLSSFAEIIEVVKIT